MRLLWIFRTLRINFSWTIKLLAKIFSALIFICYPRRFTQPTFNKCSTYILPKKIRKPPVFWFFPGYISGTSIENRLRKEVNVNCIQRYIEDPAVHLRGSVFGKNITPFALHITVLMISLFTAFHGWVGGFFPHTLCKIWHSYTIAWEVLKYICKLYDLHFQFFWLIIFMEKTWIIGTWIYFYNNDIVRNILHFNYFS